jgi:phosphoribosylamine--glycine ligase
MNILILGSGGREHAFAWKCAQDPRISKIFVAQAMQAQLPKLNAKTSMLICLDNQAID